jgi:thiosulfate/3-mercaptopyruvate sulfurtransferase
LTFGPLVSGSWLVEHIDGVRVVDVRWYLGGPPGWDAYAEGHIPGAVFLDVDADLAAPATPQDGRHPLPTPEHFATALGRVGIGEGQPVVAYDDRGGSVATRLWWMLRALGEPVAVLDGGLRSWPGELTRNVPMYPRVERAPLPWPDGPFVDADAVAATSIPVLDARTRERFEHGDPTIDPKPGHIPGARSAPWAGNLDPQTERFPTSRCPARALRRPRRDDRRDRLLRLGRHVLSRPAGPGTGRRPGPAPVPGLVEPMGGRRGPPHRIRILISMCGYGPT